MKFNELSKKITDDSDVNLTIETRRRTERRMLEESLKRWDDEEKANIKKERDKKKFDITKYCCMNCQYSSINNKKRICSCIKCAQYKCPKGKCCK